MVTNSTVGMFPETRAKGGFRDTGLFEIFLKNLEIQAWEFVLFFKKSRLLSKLRLPNAMCQRSVEWIAAKREGEILGRCRNW